MPSNNYSNIEDLVKRASSLVYYIPDKDIYNKFIEEGVDSITAYLAVKMSKQLRDKPRN